MNLSGIEDRRFLVIGDVIIDHYRLLKATRVSPEAPVLIFQQEEDYCAAGGAANVANNIVAMGASPQNVTLVSVARWGTKAPKLNFNQRFCHHGDRTTTVKERLITKRQQVARIDWPARPEINAAEKQEMLSVIDEEIQDADCIVFSDYDHGVMSDEVIPKVVEWSEGLGIPSVVDSKAKDTLKKYRGASILLPSLKEAIKFAENEGSSPDHLAKYLMSEMDLAAIGLTMGPEGIYLLEEGKPGRIFPPLENDTEDEVVDVTGAGDTVTAAVALGLALKWDYAQCMELGNVAAGIVVQKLGTSTASRAEIEDVLSKRR